MRKLLISIFALLILLPQATFAAIAFDAVSSSASAGQVASLTWSHTTSAGSNTILFVSVGLFDNFTNPTLPITGITYAGVSMTKIDCQGVSTTSQSCLYYLVAPATGANNIIVSVSPNTNVRGIGTSYTGASQTGVPDATNRNTGSGTGFTATLTTVADQSWLVMAGFGNNGGLAAGAGTTMRANPGSGSGAREGGFDSNGPISPAGSASLIQTNSSDNYGFVIASFAPAAAAANTSANLGSFLSFWW